VYKAGREGWHPQNTSCHATNQVFWLGVDGGDTDRDRVVLLAHVVPCVVRLPFQLLAVYLVLVTTDTAVLATNVYTGV